MMAVTSASAHASAPSGLNYNPWVIQITQNQPMTPALMSNTGGAPTAIYVSPALPPGLSINQTNGTISGTPTTVSAAKTYGIGAVNSSGSSWASISIQVVAAPAPSPSPSSSPSPKPTSGTGAPSGLSYTPSSLVLKQNQAMTPAIMANKGGAPTAIYVSPALPAGLSINQTTGTISGTPTVVSASKYYGIGVVNASGSSWTGITIQVAASASPSPSPSASPSPSPKPSPSPSPKPSTSPSPSPSPSVSPSPKPSSSPSPSPTPSSSPSPVAGILIHIRSENDAFSYVAPSAWATTAKWLDYINTGGAQGLDAYNAGIQISEYVDPHLCSGNWSAGPNGPNGSYSSPDCSKLPMSAFYNTGTDILTMTGVYSYIDAIGNPASPTLQSALAAQIKTDIAPSGARAYATIAEIDDAGSMEEFESYPGYSHICLGDPTSGKCLTPFTGTTPSSIPGYTYAGWFAGEQAFAKNSPIPVWWNGLQATQSSSTYVAIPAIASVAAATDNVFGAMCEDCFFDGGNPYQMSGPLGDMRMDGVLFVENGKKHALLANFCSASDSACREKGMAYLALMFDPDLTIIKAGPCGLNGCPENGLTFYQPLKPFPQTHADLMDSGGAYYREFAACYYKGKLLGPCAAAVNPTLPYDNKTVPLPKFTQKYGHVLVSPSSSNDITQQDPVFTGAMPANIPSTQGMIFLP